MQAQKKQTVAPKNNLRKRVWDREQDGKLVSIIADIGPQQWENVATRLGGRTGKQCRERWFNQVNPLLKKSPWSHEEEWVLFMMHKSRENQWAEYKNVLIGRSDNSIKNYWNSTMQHRNLQFTRALGIYLSERTSSKTRENLSEDPTLKNQVLTQSLLKHYTAVSNRQYLDHIKEKIDRLRIQLGSQPVDSSTYFLLKMVETALLSPMALSAMRNLELENFFKTFLQNKPNYVHLQRILSELEEIDGQAKKRSVSPVSMSPVLGKRLHSRLDETPVCSQSSPFKVEVIKDDKGSFVMKSPSEKSTDFRKNPSVVLIKRAEKTRRKMAQTFLMPGKKRNSPDVSSFTNAVRQEQYEEMTTSMSLSKDQRSQVITATGCDSFIDQNSSSLLEEQSSQRITNRMVLHRPTDQKKASRRMKIKSSQRQPVQVPMQGYSCPCSGHQACMASFYYGPQHHLPPVQFHYPSQHSFYHQPASYGMQNYHHMHQHQPTHPMLHQQQVINHPQYQQASATGAANRRQKQPFAMAAEDERQLHQGGKKVPHPPRASLGVSLFNTPSRKSQSTKSLRQQQRGIISSMQHQKEGHVPPPIQTSPSQAYHEDKPVSFLDLIQSDGWIRPPQH